MSPLNDVLDGSDRGANVQFTGLQLENVTITLFDLAGKSLLVSKANAELWQTNLSDLAGGITGEITYVDGGFSHVVAGIAE